MKIKKMLRDENGEAVVEASLVFPIVLFVIFVLLYLGFLLHQHILLTAIANETAMNVGQIYSTPSKDPFVGYVESKDMAKTDLYRNLYNTVGGWFSATQGDTLEGKVQTKAGWFARYRLVKRRLFKEKGAVGVTVDFERKKGTLLQKIVIVKVEATYEMPIVRLLGIRNSTIHMATVGRAECLDLLDYNSTLHLTNTAVADMFTGLGESLNNLMDKIQKLKEKLGG